MEWIQIEAQNTFLKGVSYTDVCHIAEEGCYRELCRKSVNVSISLKVGFTPSKSMICYQNIPEKKDQK